jgi:CheY-like chemotaxis protein
MKLRQILINILGNSVKFTPEGGTVSLTVEEGRRFNGKATVKYIIKDTGIGMSKEFIPHIFDTFSQEDLTITNKYGSTGLGMSITKHLVDIMDGHIDVESEKGKGSTFIVTLTLGEVQGSIPDSEEGEALNGVEGEIVHERADLKGRRILVAEDMEINAEIIIDLLELENIRADHAENGLAAVRMFENSDVGTYAAILMDVRMPEMDGLEATAAIRKLDREDAKRIPIVALTANAFDEDVQRSMQAGMNAHLSKPVDSEQLIRTLGELIYEAERGDDTDIITIGA